MDDEDRNPLLSKIIVGTKGSSRAHSAGVMVGERSGKGLCGSSPA